MPLPWPFICWAGVRRQSPELTDRDQPTPIHSNQSKDQDGVDSNENNSTELEANELVDGEHPSGTTTPNSTETYQFSHEPFETYQFKVAALAQRLFDSDDITVRQHNGGSYNRVVVISAQVRMGKIDCIIRIPRHSDPAPDEDFGNQVIDRKLLNDAAILQYLARKELVIPRLLAFDATAENEIASPYSLHRLASGIVLEDIYSSMSLTEKLSISIAVADFLARMKCITFPMAGKLRAPVSDRIQLKALALQGLRAVTKLDTGGFPVVYGQMGADRPAAHTFEFLSHLLQAHKEQAVSSSDMICEDLWERIQKILDEMHKLNFFQEGMHGHEVNVVYHWDFEPRNILVRKATQYGSADDEAWEIDTVIDWDDVNSVPSILARKPPAWLWDFADLTHDTTMVDDYGYDGDVDLLSPTRYEPGVGVLTKDEAQIKSTFEGRYIARLQLLDSSYTKEVYQDQAYGREKYIRRLARFIMDTFGASQQLTRLDRLKEDWEEYYKQQVSC